MLYTFKQKHKYTYTKMHICKYMYTPSNPPYTDILDKCHILYSNTHTHTHFCICLENFWKDLQEIVNNDSKSRFLARLVFIIMKILELMIGRVWREPKVIIMPRKNSPVTSPFLKLVPSHNSSLIKIIGLLVHWLNTYISLCSL